MLAKCYMLIRIKIRALISHRYIRNETLSLFKRGKMGTSEIDCGTKLRRSHVCLHSQAGNRL